MKVKLLSRVRLFATPWTVAHQAPLSVGFSRQEYWSGLPFPSPGDLPDPGIEPRSPASRADTLTSEPPGKPLLHKDRSKSLSSALIICRMTSLWIPQITVSNQIKSLIPCWKTELEGPREPRTLLPLPEDSSSDSRSRTHGGVREKMENDHCKGVNRLQRCRWRHPGSGNRCFRRW